jgi:DNA-directed RNA polymerase specialized sigma subunit
MNASKKMLKLAEDLEEELSCEEIIAKYEPYLSKKAIDYTFVAKKFEKHKFLIEYDDLKQQTYLGAYKAFNGYDISKGLLFYTYLKSCIEAYLKDAIADKNDVYEKFFNNEEIKDLFNVLNEKEKRIIQLRYLNDIGQVETSKIVGVSQAQVSRVIKKALLKMRNQLNLIKESEKNFMPKLKPTVPEVVEYLINNADPNMSFTQAARKYAKSLGLSITTLVSILNKSNRCNYVKALYKPTPNNVCTIDEDIELKVKEIEREPKTLFASDEIKEEAISITELSTSNNPLDGLEIRSLDAVLPNGVEFKLADNQVALNGIWMKRDELEKFPEASQKALEIFDFLYK